MQSRWNELIECFGEACERLREDIAQARSAVDVIDMLSACGAPAHVDEQWLHGLGQAMIEAIHRQAIVDLHGAGQSEFERLLQWHMAHNLEPCCRLFPQMHASFKAALSRMACTRWLLEMPNQSQRVH
jgi:hypothetical protein